MADKADDPIALWQQMVGEMQKGFRAFGDQLSRGSGTPSEQRAAGSGGAQQQLAELMESYFVGMNLPSRAQLNALSGRLQAIEGELTDIKALLHTALTNSKPAQDAPTAPRPPSKRPGSPKVRPPAGPVPAGKGASGVPGKSDKSK